jgi:hypothetical protein
MKTCWALFSAAIFFGFLSSQATAAEAVGMTILLQLPERPGFSAL